MSGSGSLGQLGSGGAALVRGRRVGGINADVEAGLLELLFYVNLARLDERHQVAAHPGDLRDGHAALAEVKGLPGEMRGGSFAIDRGGIAVGALQAKLVGDSAYSRVDLQGLAEALVEGVGDVGGEVYGPWTGGTAGSQAGFH